MKLWDVRFFSPKEGVEVSFLSSPGGMCMLGKCSVFYEESGVDVLFAAGYREFLVS